MIANQSEMARLMALEMGKPVTECLGEMRYSEGFVEWYAEEAETGLWQHHPEPVPPQTHPGPAPTRRSRLRDHAVELSLRHSHP